MSNTRRISTNHLALTAILAALVVMLQFMGAFLHFGPFSVSLVLIPIVIGAATCGISAGALLGFIFGAVVLLSGDAAAFLAVNAPGTVITVLVKGIACGFAAGIVYRAFSNINRYLAVAAAAVICPVVNTGIFLFGCNLFFMETISAWAAGAGFENAANYIIFGLVGGNFLFELGVNIILSPVVVRLLNIKRA